MNSATSAVKYGLDEMATDPAVKELAIAILKLGEGRDAAAMITALGMAAASAVTYGVNDPDDRPRAQKFFVDEFNKACRDLP
jgi:predicted component of type VI protein secretion system